MRTVLRIEPFPLISRLNDATLCQLWGWLIVQRDARPLQAAIQRELCLRKMLAGSEAGS